MDIKSIIKKPIVEEFEAFRQFYLQQFSSNQSLLDSALKHVASTSGKMMRPMLILLSAKSCGNVNDSAFAAAAALELLHTASLLHDDVVDESNMRRGVSSLNAVYSNRIAILTGDYLLSTSLYNVAQTKNNEIIEGLSQLGRVLSTGEMLQLELQRSGDFSEEKYFDVVRNKTASLFASCGRFGALAAGADVSVVERFDRFGEILGICFQIKDDIFDYYSQDVGKPTGSDIREGKVTLPALYALSHSADENILSIAKKLKNGTVLTEEEIASLIEAAKSVGGIEYSLKRIEEFRTEALALLASLDIPDDCRAALEAYLEYVISREK
ncbi:MAG: polyprenyl synthetase family protein [Bacteroidaceae bacterium]|nr:polyprenyl synthetase family protein [Bacteroidaceae bacterium]